MNDTDTSVDALRAGLVDSLRATRAAERDILTAMTPGDRDAAPVDGSWSAKDIQAHLSAWRQRQTDRMVALREGRDAPDGADTETDEINATLHAERTGWSWEQVLSDADATADSLIAEVEHASSASLASERVVGSVMGNGAEHTIGHLAPVAEAAGVADRIVGLATIVEELVDRGGWPPRPAAFARYNLACYHALAGRLDRARALLRLALPEQEELRTIAPTDDDLIALRAEIPTLGG
jgi:hypothetical protein